MKGPTRPKNGMLKNISNELAPSLTTQLDVMRCFVLRVQLQAPQRHPETPACSNHARPLQGDTDGTILVRRTGKYTMKFSPPSRT